MSTPKIHMVIKVNSQGTTAYLTACTRPAPPKHRTEDWARVTCQYCKRKRPDLTR